MKEIMLRANIPSKKFSNIYTMSGKCNCGHCNCNCGSGCLSPLLAKQIVLSTKGAY